MKFFCVFLVYSRKILYLCSIFRMTMITLYTIGFTKKSAEQFFELLNAHQVRTLLGLHLNHPFLRAKCKIFKDFPIYICIYGIFFVPLQPDFLCAYMHIYMYA